MIKSGAQIRAARALLGMRRVDLARAAGRHANAVKYWEARDIPQGCQPIAIDRIATALKAKGVVAFADPLPGVRFVSERQFCHPIKRARQT